jgi:hypothetical protein
VGSAGLAPLQVRLPVAVLLPSQALLDAMELARLSLLWAWEAIPGSVMAVAVGARAHLVRGGRARNAGRVGPVAAGRMTAQVRFWEHLREPCSFQIAWNGSKSNGFF